MSFNFDNYLHINNLNLIIICIDIFRNQKWNSYFACQIKYVPTPYK